MSLRRHSLAGLRAVRADDGGGGPAGEDFGDFSNWTSAPRYGEFRDGRLYPNTSLEATASVGSVLGERIEDGGDGRRAMVHMRTDANGKVNANAYMIPDVGNVFFTSQDDPFPTEAITPPSVGILVQCGGKYSEEDEMASLTIRFTFQNDSPGPVYYGEKSVFHPNFSPNSNYWLSLEFTSTITGALWDDEPDIENLTGTPMASVTFDPENPEDLVHNSFEEDADPYAMMRELSVRPAVVAYENADSIDNSDYYGLYWNPRV